ncbi:Myb-related protein MYBAS2 [Hordeum vulgare]|nr:Myb-related protein MYBAS2 [Hordeum vulgare]
MAARKGPWTEKEDAQLVWFVRLLGERRWDFLAQVSGLRRTGKSCRLRWVNYLHPGLKRGRITADEERLILTLHAEWGSRWSRIARKLPGRTDNEIKNYWRTHMRKKAQEEKMMAKNKASSSSPSSSDSTAATSLTTTTTCSASTPTATSSTTDAPQTSMGDEAEEEASTSATEEKKAEVVQYCSAVDMDQLWNDIAASERYPDMMMSWGAAGHAAVAAPALEPSSPVWDLCEQDYYSLWRIDDQEYYNKIDQHALN